VTSPAICRFCKNALQRREVMPRLIPVDVGRKGAFPVLTGQPWCAHFCDEGLALLARAIAAERAEGRPEPVFAVSFFWIGLRLKADLRSA